METINDVATLTAGLKELAASIEASVAVFHKSIDLAAEVHLSQANVGVDGEGGLPLMWVGRCIGEITINGDTTKIDTWEI